MRRIGIVTTSRADYGLYRPVIAAIDAHGELTPELIVSGSHLLASHGMTVSEIEADGWPIHARIAAMDGDTTASGNARTGARTLSGIAETLADDPPDWLLMLGDRYEMLAAAVAAVPFNIPIAHIHGGEVSFGAIDDACRHAITKLAHLHFPSTEGYARRLRQMGEEDWRITVSGAPGLDAAHAADVLERDEIEQRFDVSFDGQPSIVTFHPVTREPDALHAQLTALEAALVALDHPLIMTGSNVDTGGSECSAMLQRVAEKRSDAYYVESFGSAGYMGALRHVGAMIGNSSSGITEGAAFSLPVVNIGNRQDGRERAANVIDCAPETDAILQAVHRARSDAFRQSFAGMPNPFGDGHAAPRIAARLADTPIDARLLAKRFVDHPVGVAS